MRVLHWQALFALTSLLTACATIGGNSVIINETAVPPVPTLDAQQVTLGETLYVQNCASCHGDNLEGQPEWKKPLADGSLPAPPHNDSGHTWHHPDSLLLDIILRGGAAVYNSPAINSKMPAFGDKLTPNEARAVLSYIKSYWGKDSLEFQWWMTTTRDAP